MPSRLLGQVDAARMSASAAPVSLLIRSHDDGMSHIANMTAEILKPHPDVAVGVQLMPTFEDKQEPAGRPRRADVSATSGQASVSATSG